MLRESEGVLLYMSSETIILARIALTVALFSLIRSRGELILGMSGGRKVISNWLLFFPLHYPVMDLPYFLSCVNHQGSTLGGKKWREDTQVVKKMCMRSRTAPAASTASHRSICRTLKKHQLSVKKNCRKVRSLPDSDIWDAQVARESCEGFTNHLDSRWLRRPGAPSCLHGCRRCWQGPSSAGRDVPQDLADRSCSGSTAFTLEMTPLICVRAEGNKKRILHISRESRERNKSEQMG